MAAREGQGLQIAVIIFAMLTIILAITTYIFYASAATAKKEKDSAVAQAGQKQMEIGKLGYRVTAMKYVLGMPGVTMQEVELEKGKAGGADQETDDMLKKFEGDMAAIGDHAAPDEAKNYGTLAKILLATVNKKNASFADANTQTRKSQADMAAVETREKGRADTSEAAMTKYKTDLETATTQYTSARTDLQGQMDKMAAELAAKDQKVKAEVDAVTKSMEKQTTQINQQQNTIQRLQEDIKSREKQELTENPDGKIIWVNQGQQLVWINLGRADGLLRQTTFRVYAHDENNVAAGKRKGSIEVLQLKEDHVAEARILEDSVTNPILPGDVIHTPIWSPGQKIHFALIGRMDIDGDKRDDYDRVRTIIEMNGGVIDASLRPDGTRTGPGMNVNTRYYVLGQIDAESASAKMLTELANMEKERLAHGIEKKSIEEMLSLMGWKAEERTVSLGGTKGGDFRKRAPGKTQPAASPATTPATPTPAAAETPAPAGAAPPAATLDPFAAPPPAPKPMAEPDPFAVPK